MQVLYIAWKRVRQNNGVPGVYGQTCAAFEENLMAELSCLLLELKEKRYRASARKQISIAKEGGGERHLDTPTGRDRIVQIQVGIFVRCIADSCLHEPYTRSVCTVL